MVLARGLLFKCCHFSQAQGQLATVSENMLALQLSLSLPPSYAFLLEKLHKLALHTRWRSIWKKGEGSKEGGWEGEGRGYKYSTYTQISASVTASTYL